VRACACLNAADLDESVPALFRALHQALVGSRGAAVTLCIFEGDKLRGGGVGNVTLRSEGATVAALLTPGIVGGPRNAVVREFTAQLTQGVRLALFSDGLAADFDLALVRKLDLAAACAAAFARSSRAHDDATLLMAEVVATAAPG